jgi:hypothetical protein
MKSKNIKYHNYFETFIELIDDTIFNKMLSLEEVIAEDLEKKEREIRCKEISIEKYKKEIERLKQTYQETQEESKFNNVQTDIAKEAIRLFSAIAEIAKEDEECFRYASYIVYAFLNNAKENGCE